MACETVECDNLAPRGGDRARLFEVMAPAAARISGRDPTLWRAGCDTDQRMVRSDTITPAPISPSFLCSADAKVSDSRSVGLGGVAGGVDLVLEDDHGAKTFSDLRGRNKDGAAEIAHT
jgi:hypothetical protein